MSGSALSSPLPPPWAWAVLVGLIGALAGRVLGILIRELALAEGYPAAPQAAPGARGSRWEFVPALGPLLATRRPGSRRAAILEFLGAVVVLACWRLFPPAQAAAGSVFALGLIGASVIDLDHMIIPDFFSIGLAGAGVILSFCVPALHRMGPFSAEHCLRSGAAALLGVALGSALPLWFGLVGERVLQKEVIGFGDVKFLGAIGAFCGWQGAVFSLFGGAVVGAGALLLAALHERLAPGRSAQLFRLESAEGQSARVGWGIQFPFGPMLATAAGLYFFALHPWVDGYLARYQALF
jgi:leader peptidase (prepilin peptidase)/N-methyltransferase